MLSYPIHLPKSCGLFFVAGTMKSGTSWLKDLLNEFPSVICQAEMSALHNAGTDLTGLLDQNWSPGSGNLTLEYLAHAPSRLEEWLMMRNKGYNKNHRAEPARQAYLEEFRLDLFRHIFEWTYLHSADPARLAAARWCGEKSPVNHPDFCQTVARHFAPYRVKIVHLVRDPRSVAVSRWHHLRSRQYHGNAVQATPFLDGADQERCRALIEDKTAPSEATFYQGYDDLFQAVAREWSSTNTGLAAQGPACFEQNYLRVRYEDLVEDFSRQTQRLAAFFEVELPEQRLRQLRERSQAGKLGKNTFREGRAVGDYSCFGARMEQMKAWCGESARAFGYDLDRA